MCIRDRSTQSTWGENIVYKIKAILLEITSKDELEKGSRFEISFGKSRGVFSSIEKETECQWTDKLSAKMKIALIAGKKRKGEGQFSIPTEVLSGMNSSYKFEGELKDIDSIKPVCHVRIHFEFLRTDEALPAGLQTPRSVSIFNEERRWDQGNEIFENVNQTYQMEFEEFKTEKSVQEENRIIDLEMRIHELTEENQRLKAENKFYLDKIIGLELDVNEKESLRTEALQKKEIEHTKEIQMLMLKIQQYEQNESMHRKIKIEEAPILTERVPETNKNDDKKLGKIEEDLRSLRSEFVESLSVKVGAQNTEINNLNKELGQLKEQLQELKKDTRSNQLERSIEDCKKSCNLRFQQIESTLSENPRRQDARIEELELKFKDFKNEMLAKLNEKVVLEKIFIDKNSNPSSEGMKELSLSPQNAISKKISTHLDDGLVLYPVSYTHLRAHETPEHLVCRLLLEKKKEYSLQF
eukprot:TRINITY_DN528_c0_g1_i5.p1 TRINITY_DN528_c0_g1~~TRINITY_DN528_c0_g1_i5.p1  ORF type:complete len:469 (+),score=87.95 TRINITY_DN528_c0_g1_i5:99-1505(+)